MKFRWVHVWVSVLVCIIFSSSANDFFSSTDLKSDGVNVNRAAPARRSLLSDPNRESETALIAALDGTIYLFDVTSKKPIWSFTSGPPIYSAHQSPIHKESTSEIGSGYFIDTGAGDDWELYAHNGLGKLKLKKSIEAYVSSTPQIAEDGGVVLGSKRSTVFQVDANTGRLISTYTMPGSPEGTVNEESNIHYKSTDWKQGLPGSVDVKHDESPLYITRTDYALVSFVPNSNEVLWNVTVAEIGAAFLCQGIDDPSAGVNLDSRSVDESGTQFNMPLPCNSWAQVHRFRGPNLLERLSSPNWLPEAHNPDKTPSKLILPSQPNVDKISKLLLSSPYTGLYPDNHGENGQRMKGTRKLINDRLSVLSERFSMFTLLIFTFMLVGTISRNYLVRRPISLLEENVTPKKKKSRKSAKSGGSVVKKDEGVAKKADIESGNSLLSNLNHQTSHNVDGRTIGKLFVSSKEIAKGSNGTVVFEGIYQGRSVAVKRLVRAHHDIAFKEIQNLIASDQHPNIVRWYGVEQDQDFVYLALERCICNLNDLIQICSVSFENNDINKGVDAESLRYRIHLDSLKHDVQGIYLWKENGYPSDTLLKLLRDVVSGLVHLHELGIIHRDLKPQNVLITKERVLCAKVSDMGISKCLTGDMSSLGHHATGHGSPGWQAPEQLLQGRQTRALDLFSLGCVLFHSISGGSHPFGSPMERDINITKNKIDLFLVNHIPEAMELFSRLLDPNAEMRPKAVEVLLHPFFWTSEMRLAFLRDASDRLELEDRETGSVILKALEGTSRVSVCGTWDSKMDPILLKDIGRFRRYKFDSVRDLLRVIRNKSNHYRELPTDIQELLGPLPEGFNAYFTSRFPQLLIQVYKVVSTHCREEELFQKYFTNSAL
ncbi:unnamed protein product [Cuscuta campestris]|uniref:non-specific serine/threonine protein kinase n=1 Tax=Cuscuta campestris TaxID=132261 RepID=A0A484N0M3_9ASTE|nr:unnamed protein product [Cuscuta campestris]